MKTIKIFLASSDELEDDRNAFGNLVRRLDKIYETRGIRIELFEWEDYDAAYNDRRKQDEYNEKVKASDMFLALFRTKAGKFTIEEFDVATEEFRKHASPKVYVYCKDLLPEEQASPELMEFKRKLYEEMGHYWSRYQNRDSMQLHFVMQLQLVENSKSAGKLRVEDGMVLIEDMPIAKLDNLQFAAGNAAYQKMSVELAELPEIIDKARKRADNYPADEDLQNELQLKLDRYNSLKKDFAQLQQALFETAHRITIMQQERVSDMLRRAIDAFEEGNIERANTLLDEMAIEAEQHIEQLDQQRELVHQDIEAFLLQAKTVMADSRTSIDERIKKTYDIYSRADEWAVKSALPNEKYETLLNDYSIFLFDYAFYKKALDITQRLLLVSKQNHGTSPFHMGDSYNRMGLVYLELNNFDEALGNCLKALDVFTKAEGVNTRNVAAVYNSIASIYSRKCDYNNALDYYYRTLSICERVLGDTHTLTATAYTNIGLVYQKKGEFDKALKYSIRGLEIRNKLLDDNHIHNAQSYTNLSSIYFYLCNYDKALEYSLKANSIFEMQEGKNHLDTAASYYLTGWIYNSMKEYEKSLEFHQKALQIREDYLGINHAVTANSYSAIGHTFANKGDYQKSIVLEVKALKIRLKLLGDEHIDTAHSFAQLGDIHYNLAEYDMALKCHLKALSIREKVLGTNHPDTAYSYGYIGYIYDKLKAYTKSLDYFLKLPPIYQKIYGANHSNTINSYKNISNAYWKIGNIAKAKEYEQRALQNMGKGK